MSWRRFSTLVRGLSPSSALVAAASGLMGTEPIEDSEEAERAVNAIWPSK